MIEDYRIDNYFKLVKEKNEALLLYIQNEESKTNIINALIAENNAIQEMRDAHAGTFRRPAQQKDPVIAEMKEAQAKTKIR